MPEESPETRRLEEQRDDIRLLNQVMRHDIRNDLQLIGAYAELLEDHVDEEGREYLDVIKESTENAVGLTTTVRDLAEVMLSDGGETGSVPLAGALNRRIEETRSGYPKAVVTVEGTIPEVDVVANDMLGSVFRNLLQNAIQHNDKTPPEVTVWAAETDAGVEVYVADNGPGIPDARKEEIFGKAEKGLESPGAGIGLYLVRSLVEGYGGEVWVEDRADRTVPGASQGDGAEGSVFVVRLPPAE